MAYTKTTWADKNVQFPNRFTKTGESAGGVTLVPDPGTVTQAGTALSASNMNKIEDGIAAAHAMATDAQSMPVTLAHGLNVLTTSNPSPARLTAYGLTRVNLLGTLGRSTNLSNFGTSGQNANSVSLTNDTVLINGMPTIKVTSDAISTNGGIVISTSLTDATKYYLFRASVINNSMTNANLQVRNSAFNVTAGTSSTYTQTGKIVDMCLKISPSQLSGMAGSNFKLYVRSDFVAGGGKTMNVGCWGAFEITAAEYAKIDVDPEWTGDKLADKFPYVDSVQHTQGVAVRQVGRNLLQGFPDVLNANAVVVEPYKVTLTATANNQGTDWVASVPPSTQLTFSFGTLQGFVNIDEFNQSGASSIVATVSSSKTFTTKSDTTSVRIRFSNNASGTGTYTLVNPQLEIGGLATPFQPYNADYIYLPTNLASNLDGSVRDTAYEREGVWYKYKKWVTGVQLDGSFTWLNHVAATLAGSKRVFFNTITPAAVSADRRMTKYDGTQVSLVDPGLATDAFVFASGNLYASVANVSTGFSDAHTPLQADWKNYFNGWKMNNGTLGTAYPGTGTKYWTAIESPRANFMGKVAGSVVENPNKVWFTSGGSLQNPSGQADSVTQTGLNNLMYLDGTTANGTVSTNAQIAQQMFSFNLIEHVLRKYGSAIFGAAVTTVDRVTWLKANIGRILGNWYGYGSGPVGNKATLVWWNSSGTPAWDINPLNHTSGTVTKLTRTLTTGITNAIDANGMFHMLAFADASDGVTASTVYTDFIDLEVELNVQTVPATGLATTEFKPYKLDYVLATPIEEALTSGGGAIALQSGGNQVELLEGVVWQEAATPVKGTGSSVSNLYYINILVGTTAGFEIPIGSQLKNRADKIIGVYRNGQLDSRWSIAKSTSAYGSERAEIKAADYDPTADYTVTYINLDKYLYTTNAIEAKLEYQTSLGSAVAANVQDIADIKNSLSIIMFAMIMADIL
jgi:hypothetical protein